MFVFLLNDCTDAVSDGFSIAHLLEKRLFFMIVKELQFLNNRQLPLFDLEE